MAVIERQGRKLAPSQLSVLIVDDQQFYRNLVTELCKSIGIFRVATAIDGADAIEAMSDLKPNLIICDWVMPEMDGIEFTKKVRSLRHEDLRRTPIIMVTSNNLVTQIAQALEAGIDTFALKPVSAKAIFDRIRETIETPRAFIETDTYSGPCRRRNRKPENYRGEFRRLDDPSMIEASIEEENRVKLQLRQKALSLRALVADLQSNKTTNLETIIAQSKVILKIAQNSGDDQLARVCWSLSAYIDKCHAGSNLRIDIVKKHLESMDVLINTPLSQEAARTELAASLHKIVIRALQAA